MPPLGSAMGRFSGRNESEVVIRPKYLRGLKKRRVNVGKDEMVNPIIQ